MEPKIINSTELRTKTRDLMERVKFNGEAFVVETFGRPMAVIISFEDFNRVRELLGIAVKPSFAPISKTEELKMCDPHTRVE